MVTKTDYKTKIKEIEDKKQSMINLSLWLVLIKKTLIDQHKLASLAAKANIADCIKKTYFHERLRNINKELKQNMY